MKLNPKIFEGWRDPAGGEWIRIKSGVYENVVWRPHDIKFPDDDNRMTFEVEYFDGPGFAKPLETDNHFSEVCGSIIVQILEEAMKDHEDKL